MWIDCFFFLCFNFDVYLLALAIVGTFVLGIVKLHNNLKNLPVHLFRYYLEQFIFAQ